MGQAFKFLLEANKNFKNILNKTISNLNINFTLPIVGWFFCNFFDTRFWYFYKKIFYFFRIHVRRGVKILWEAKAVSLVNYMRYVTDFYDKYFFNNPDKIGKVNRTVYLVTEDLDVLNEALTRYKIIWYIFKRKYRKNLLNCFFKAILIIALSITKHRSDEQATNWHKKNYTNGKA